MIAAAPDQGEARSRSGDADCASDTESSLRSALTLQGFPPLDSAALYDLDQLLTATVDHDMAADQGSIEASDWLRTGQLCGPRVCAPGSSQRRV